MTNLSQDMLRSIEADSFWCMSKLLDGIQARHSALAGRPGWAFGLLLTLLRRQGPAPSTAPPLCRPCRLTSFSCCTAFRRQWSRILWSLRKSPHGPALVIRLCLSFLLGAGAGQLASIAPAPLGFPTLCSPVRFLCPPKRWHQL